MTSAIVQFREDETNLRFLRSKGLNPNEFGRAAFEAALRELRAKEARDGVNVMRERIRARLGERPFFEGNLVDLVRSDRDSR